MGIYKGYKASRWIRIVKFGPINSGKSFNLNRTLTLYSSGWRRWCGGKRIAERRVVCRGALWRARIVETAKPFYTPHTAPPAWPVKTVNTIPRQNGAPAAGRFLQPLAATASEGISARTQRWFIYIYIYIYMCVYMYMYVYINYRIRLGFIKWPGLHWVLVIELPFRLMCLKLARIYATMSIHSSQCSVDR